VVHALAEVRGGKRLPHEGRPRRDDHFDEGVAVGPDGEDVARLDGLGVQRFGEGPVAPDQLDEVDVEVGVSERLPDRPAHERGVLADHDLGEVLAHLELRREVPRDGDAGVRYRPTVSR
jgi:hypothetical protein